MISLLGILAVLLLTLVVLLAIPLTLYFSLSWPLKKNDAINLNWFFGLVRLRLPLQEPVSKGLRRQEKKHRAKNRKTKTTKPAKSSNLVRIRSRVSALTRFTRRCGHSIEKKNIRVWLRMGLGDPADTGLLWGTIAPLVAVYSKPGRITVDIVPEFNETVIELSTSGSIRFVPLQMIALFIGFIASPAVWRAPG